MRKMFLSQLKWSGEYNFEFHNIRQFIGLRNCEENLWYESLEFAKASEKPLKTFSSLQFRGCYFLDQIVALKSL